LGPFKSRLSKKLRDSFLCALRSTRTGNAQCVAQKPRKNYHDNDSEDKATARLRRRWCRCFAGKKERKNTILYIKGIDQRGILVSVFAVDLYRTQSSGVILELVEYRIDTFVPLQLFHTTTTAVCRV
jgi:hypothetical protein